MANGIRRRTQIHEIMHFSAAAAGQTTAVTSSTNMRTREYNNKNNNSKKQHEKLFYLDDDIENSNTEVAILHCSMGAGTISRHVVGLTEGYQLWCFLRWSATIYEMEPLDMQSGDLHVTLTSSPWLHRSLRSLSGRHEVAGYLRK